MREPEANWPLWRVWCHYGTFRANALLATAILGLGACGASTATSPPSSASAPLRCARNDTHLRFAGDERTEAQLVPVEATTLVLCSYHGLNPNVHQAGELAASRRIASRARIAALTSLFNRLPDQPPSNEPIVCPMDDGSKDAAVFRYSDESDVTVAIKLTGCTFVTNGEQRRALTRRLERALHRALGPT